MRPGLLTPTRSYKPIRYPWALEACRRQHEIHWLPQEIPLGEDIRDWRTLLTDTERSLLMNIFRFFTQADVEVNDCYMTRYSQVFMPTEVRMMLSAFSGMETVHILAYALLLETLGVPDDEFSAFLRVPAMATKVDYMSQFGVETTDDILLTTAMFGGATEGLSLYSMFAMLMSFPQRNRMKGMGQIVSWSVRDESLHAASIIKLHNTLADEVGGRPAHLDDYIVGMFEDVVRQEDAFIDVAFEAGPIPAITPEEMKQYIRFVADWRLGQLRLPPHFGVSEHPLPWLQILLSGQEHANFFEARATEYAKGATRGEWDGAGGVWDAFQSVPVRRPSDLPAARPEGYYER